MTRLLFPALLGATLIAGAAQPALAYTYTVEKTEPLLDGREAMFQAAESGFWMAAKMSLESMRAEIAYLDENEDAGISASFDAAIAAKDAAALRAAFLRAASDEILRRLKGASDNFDDYENAKLLVVAANRFYTAVAADLPPEASAVIARQMPVALDALGNPGVLGMGARPADRAVFGAARAAIHEALGKPAP